MNQVGAVQKKKSLRLRASFVMCASAVLMLVVVRGSFAAPAEKITICHANNSASNPYISVSDSLDGSNGSSANDHTLHTGPIATSLEVAQQMKDDHIDWGDIIPPFGDYPGLNWTDEGQAIYNNDCSYAVASDGSDDSTDAQDDSSDSQDDSTDAQDDSSDSQDDSADAQDDSSDQVDDSSDDSTDDGSDVLSDDSNADDGSAPSDDGGEVLGNVITKTKPLATTGSETTILAMIGFAMLLAGSAMRFGRFGRTAYATVSHSPADLLAKKLEARSRHWTCRK